MPTPATHPEKPNVAVTPFQQRVYEALCRVPAGRVCTYKTLGDAIGCCSPRAVGQALRRNPFAPVVPCHRVIAGDLTLGGFNGQTGGAELRRKRELLATEGVRFDDTGLLLDRASLHPFPQTNMAPRTPFPHP